MTHDHHHGAEHIGTRALVWAVVINLGLSVFEFGAGLVAQSTALIADALHNTNDAGALLIALIARVIAKRKADDRFTFGYRRAELIGAMIQLTALVVVGLFLVWEAVERILQPTEVHGAWVMATAAVALVVDMGTAWLLWAMAKGSLNVRAAFLHNLSDAGASLAVLAGGAAIFFMGWDIVDPLLTLIIAGLVLFMGIRMLKRTSSILMESVPEGFDLPGMIESLRAVDGVEDIHHVHVWELSEHHRALEAHVVIADDAFPKGADIKKRLRRLLEQDFDIAHATLEVEAQSEECSSPGGC